MQMMNSELQLNSNNSVEENKTKKTWKNCKTGAHNLRQDIYKDYVNRQKEAGKTFILSYQS